MTPEQQRRVRDLFEQVVDRDPASVAAWLSTEAGGDPTVRQEVLSLLAHHSVAGAFLAEPIADRLPLLDEDESFASGSVVGPYTIDRELGRGGMGRVYLARDNRLGRTVALKVLAPHFVGDAKQRERLRREARAAALLAHPGICTVYALEEIDGELVIASEFVDGRTLREEMDGRRPPPAEVLRTAREFAAALASAHAHGIVHRDLKPENIMRTRDGRLKILDFGLARLVEDEEGDRPAAALRVTHTGVILGTPAYMAPEQLRRQTVDARADVFAFGVLLYEYACGVHPLHAREPIAVAPALGDVIARCMREVPAERFASAAEVLVALDGDTAARQRAPNARWWRTHQAVVAALYIVGAVLGWLIKEWKETPMTVAIFLALGAGATIGGVLRGHLVFTASMNPKQLDGERRRSSRATRLADLLIAALLFADGVLIAGTRALGAVTAFSLAIGILLAALLLEPATTIAAFGDAE